MSSKLQWIEEPHHHESLAVCLRAILAAQDLRVPYDELVCTLGLAGAMVAVPDEPSLAAWATYARDAFLVDAAATYGLRIRDMHPPQAAAGLKSSAEFAQHFIDSYAPLIRRALENDQPVLAWRGWGTGQWGVITGETHDSFEGLTTSCDGRVSAMSTPAHQVYVVEGFDAPPPSAREPMRLFSEVSDRTERWWRGDLPAPVPVLTGSRAYELWQARLAAARKETSAWSRLQPEVSTLQHVLTAARGALASWLRSILPQLHMGSHNRATHVIKLSELYAMSSISFNDKAWTMAAEDEDAFEVLMDSGPRHLARADEWLIDILTERA